MRNRRVARFLSSAAFFSSRSRLRSVERSVSGVFSLCRGPLHSSHEYFGASVSIRQRWRRGAVAEQQHRSAGAEVAQQQAQGSSSRNSRAAAAAAAALTWYLSVWPPSPPHAAQDCHGVAAMPTTTDYSA